MILLIDFFYFYTQFLNSLLFYKQQFLIFVFILYYLLENTGGFLV